MLLVVSAHLLAGCWEDAGNEFDGDGFSSQLNRRWSKAPVIHDFGTVLHGQVGRADIEIPQPTDLGPMIPIGFQRNCSCARHEFVIIRPDGQERIANERPESEFAIQEGEKLFLRLSLHTSELETEDLAHNMVRGHVVLQEDGGLFRREFVPVQFSYAIETPIQVKPFAHLDIGEIARSARYRQTFKLRSRMGSMTLGTPRCIEPEIGNPDNWIDCKGLTAKLTREGETHLLHVSFAPSELRPEGPMIMAIVIPTDLAHDYVFRLPVSGTLIPDIQLSPPGKFFFGTIDFTKPAKQYMVITDHHPNRTLEFTLKGIVDANGKDISTHFDLEISSVPENPRSKHLTLTYDGAIALDGRRFTGMLYLGTQDGHDDVIDLEIVAFHRQSRQ